MGEEEASRDRMPLVRRAAAVVCLLATLVAAALVFVDVRNTREQHEAEAVVRREHLDDIVADLEQKALEIESLSARVAAGCATWAATGGEHDPDALAAMLRNAAASTGHVSGIGVCFVPEAVGNTLLGLNLLVDRNELRRIEESYDYSDPAEPNSVWYHTALAHPGGLWHDPYFGGSSRRMLIEHTIGVHRDGELIGVVFVNWRYDDIRSMLLSLDVGGTNEAVVITADGQVVFSGHETWFEHGVGIETVGEKLDLSAGIIATILDSTEGEEEGLESPHGEIDVCWHQVPTHGWRVILSFHDDARVVAAHQRNLGPTISIFLVLALLAAAIAIHHGKGESDWDVAMAMTIVFVLGTVYLWWLAHTHSGLSPPTEQQHLVDHSDVQAAREAYEDLSRNASEAPVFVSTGVFIQSARFVSAHDVMVTGYVWQRAPRTQAVIGPSESDAAGQGDQRIRLGIVLPEAESAQFEQVYTRKQGDDIVAGWYFTANLRQPFDYRDFPFESEEIWIRLWPRQFHRNVVLMPDLEAYDPRPATGGRGVEDGMFLPGWSVRTSYFSHRPRSYNTNFGLVDYQGQADFPELYFNVEIQRQVTSPFITHIVPLLIVLMTLFILLAVTSRESAPEIGFTSIAVIGTIVGIFFVVILQHISLRRSLQASGFVYLEIFYFLTYVYVLLVAVNAVVTVIDFDQPATKGVACARTRLGWVFFAPLALAKWGLVSGAHFLNRGGNQTMRYVYWPLYFGLIWLSTLILTMSATPPS